MSSKPLTNQTRSKGSDEAKKTLVRNCRSAPAVPVSNPPKQVQGGVSVSRPASSGEEICLKEPQLHSTLKMKENLRKMKVGMKSVKFEPKVVTEPRAKASKKVNIRFDENLYKGLIDLKVSEDDLGLRPIESGKPKDLSSSRDPVPQLSDFYQPTFNKEYVVKPHPSTFKIRKPACPSRCSSSVLETVKRWSIDDNQL